jgi:hypothetical protein
MPEKNLDFDNAQKTRRTLPTAIGPGCVLPSAARDVKNREKQDQRLENWKHGI